MRITRTTGGVYAIAPTPFDASGAVDLGSIDRLVDFYAGAGVDGLTVLGQFGEAAKLDHAESSTVAQRFLDRSPVPVVVGVSGAGFASVAALTREVMDAGAAGVMVAPPPALRTDDQIVGYYGEIAAVLGPDVPFVVQDYPLTFSVVMSVPVLRRIAVEVDTCVMLKHEDWPGLEKITALRELESSGDMPRLSIMCGNGGLFLDFELARGADGAMTGYCFPEMLVDLVALVRKGDAGRAHDLFDAHLPLIRYEQQPGLGLAVRKYVLARRGVIASSTLRRPRPALSATAAAEVDLLLARIAAVDERAALP